MRISIWAGIRASNLVRRRARGESAGSVRSISTLWGAKGDSGAIEARCLARCGVFSKEPLKVSGSEDICLVRWVWRVPAGGSMEGGLEEATWMDQCDGQRQADRACRDAEGQRIRETMYGVNPPGCIDL